MVVIVKDELLDKASQVLAKYCPSPEGNWKFHSMIRGVVYEIPMEDITPGLSNHILNLLLSKKYLLGTKEDRHIIFTNGGEYSDTFSTVFLTNIVGEGEGFKRNGIPKRVSVREYTYSEELRKFLDNLMINSFNSEYSKILTMGLYSEDVFELREIDKTWLNVEDYNNSTEW